MRKLSFLPVLSLFLSLSLLFSAGCAQQDAGLLVDPDPPSGETEAPPDDLPDDPAAADPPAEPQTPAGEAPEAAVPEAVDLSWISGRGATVESVWAASDELLFVFAASLSGGYVSEKIDLYPYSLRDHAFTGDWIPLGVVGQYPQSRMEDGTVQVLIRSSETYEYESMLFIDPDTLACAQYDLRGIEGLNAVLVSPDKSRVALSTQSGLRVTDLTFETTYAEYPGFLPENGDPDLDLHLPCAFGWLPDGTLVGGLMGWEWVYYPFLMARDGTVTPLDQLSYRMAAPFGGDLLLYDCQSILPLSVRNTADGTVTELHLPGLPDDWNEAYISAFAVDAQNRLFGLSTVDFQNQPVCRLTIGRDDRVLTETELHGTGETPPTFDQIIFTPDGQTAVLLTSATVEQARALYTLPLPE